MKTSSPFFSILLACCLLSFDSGADEVSKSSAPSKEAFKKMAELADKKSKHIEGGGFVGDLTYQELDVEFEKLVQASVTAFPEAKVLQAVETNHFNKIILNKLGAGFDGIRFRNDSAEAKDLVWVFAYPKKSSMSQWYILPASGVMRGFKTFSESQENYPNVPWAESKQPYSVIFQPLTGARIQPNAEYILWFAFAATEPEDFHVAINLVPVGTFVHGLYSQEINMGLKQAPKNESQPEKPDAREK